LGGDKAACLARESYNLYRIPNILLNSFLRRVLTALKTAGKWERLNFPLADQPYYWHYFHEPVVPLWEIEKVMGYSGGKPAEGIGIKFCVFRPHDAARYRLPGMRRQSWALKLGCIKAPITANS